MANVFFIGDTHFGHKRICEFEPDYRPFSSVDKHDEELVKRWNSVVRPKDIVWHLGDFSFGDKLPIAARLNGIKRLVMGNHDLRPAAEYLQYFERVFGMVGYKEFLLSHMPVHPDQIYRWKANIHGHMHSKAIADTRYINVSCEQIDLTPISMDELRKKHMV